MAKLKRIIFHWTAGGYLGTEIDKEFYHFIIDNEGTVFNGRYKPEDNIDCTDGKYAKHTGGGNTGSIGIAFCGMYNFNLTHKRTKYPLTQKQCEAGFKLAAELCHKYDFKPNPQTITTHYEFGKQYPGTSSAGKIDIAYLPYTAASHLQPDEVAKYIRNKVKWYYNRYNNEQKRDKR